MCEAVIFDLGGVIEKIDPPAVAEAFSKLGMSKPEDFFSLFRQSDICSLFESGKIYQKDFIDHLGSLCAPETFVSDIESAWCANQRGISAFTLETLDLLRTKGIKIYLLSNTNPIHAQKVGENFLKAHGKTLDSIFDGIYYSFEIGYRKPDKEAYLYVLRSAGLNPEQCIYVDDLEGNLKPPRELGLQCIYHKTNEEIRTIKAISDLIDSSHEFKKKDSRDSKVISVGLIGFGKSGADIHAPLISSLPGFELRAVVSSQSREKILSLYPSVHLYSSIDGLLADTSLGIDLIIIATPNHLHYQQAKLAILHGKHVIVEKPFVVHSEQGEELIKLAEEQKVVLSVFQNRRWDEDFKLIRKIIQTEKLGSVREYAACWDFFRPKIDYSVWKEQDIEGSGRFYDLGPHLIDQILSLFGWPDEVLAADIRKERKGAIADDFFEVKLGYRGRAADAFKVTLACSFLSSPIRPRFKIVGSKGTLIVGENCNPQEKTLKEDSYQDDLTVRKTRRDMIGFFPQASITYRDIQTDSQNNYAPYYHGIYEAILNGKKPPVLSEEALMVVKLIEEAMRKASTLTPSVCSKVSLHGSKG